MEEYCLVYEDEKGFEDRATHWFVDVILWVVEDPGKEILRGYGNMAGDWKRHDLVMKFSLLGGR